MKVKTMNGGIYMYLTVREKMEACMKFFNILAEELSDDYEVVGSCNKDASVYLIPKGTIDDLSYYGKPLMSFRFSDHWNWFSNTKKCKDRYHIQCNSVNIPWPNWRRHDDDSATRPRTGFQVAFYGKDKAYHHVFGDCFDREKRKWTWKEKTVQQVIKMMAEY
jgi:hypothetical protein